MPELKPLTHTGTVTLETARLLLRPTALTDAEHMFLWASAPELTKYLFWAPRANMEESKVILAAWDAKNTQPDYYHWGIVLKEPGRFIGTCGTFGIDERRRSTSLGYCLGRAYWGKGYASEAVSAIIAHFLNTVGVNRIAASHDIHNVASGRVMQKCGMAFEGVQRQSYYCPRRGFYDSAYYAILKEDFDKMHKHI